MYQQCPVEGHFPGCGQVPEETGNMHMAQTVSTPDVPTYASVSPMFLPLSRFLLPPWMDIATKNQASPVRGSNRSMSPTITNANLSKQEGDIYCENARGENRIAELSLLKPGHKLPTFAIDALSAPQNRCLLQRLLTKLPPRTLYSRLSLGCAKRILKGFKRCQERTVLSSFRGQCIQALHARGELSRRGFKRRHAPNKAQRVVPPKPYGSNQSFLTTRELLQTSLGVCHRTAMVKKDFCQGYRGNTVTIRHMQRRTFCKISKALCESGNDGYVYAFEGRRWTYGGCKLTLSLIYGKQIYHAS
ncbi:hypothetical protein DFJ43DRAFT_1044466 [Lentinula guzmanii]|uniref:Uncharacterized protein n=1 Tax=Lentinula guzmanii TaxID=2804957 RepID=A0AA38JCJ0_9AGAR|nr:hypothetical protein DFJ43DRAFT_1044466 [Lentinula guzmanii]